MEDTKNSENLSYCNFLDAWVKGGSYPGFVSSILVENSSDSHSEATTEIVHHCNGFADIAQARALNRDSIFRIYSMTKPITSLAILMLVDRRLMTLDDHLSEYLPGFANPKVYVSGPIEDPLLVDAVTPITIRHLLTHTSGISYGIFNAGTMYDKFMQNAFDLQKEISLFFRDTLLKEVCERLATVPLLFQPGTSWSYGLNTDILGYIVEMVSGKTLREFFKQEIFQPLEMIDTDFYVPPEKLHRLATCYDVDIGFSIKPSLAAERNRDKLPVFFSGGGGLVSTLDDYIKFVSYLLTSNIESSSTSSSMQQLVKDHSLMSEMFVNQLPGNKDLKSFSFDRGFSETIGEGIGFGLGLSTVIDPLRCKGGELSSIGEAGWGGIASTWFLIDKKHKMATIVMTQLIPSTAYPIRQQLRYLSHLAASAHSRKEIQERHSTHE